MEFHVLLKPGVENFVHYFASVWDEYNCAIVWAFFDISMKNNCFYFNVTYLFFDAVPFLHWSKFLTHVTFFFLSKTLL